jgi:hypothetical protein
MRLKQKKRREHYRTVIWSYFGREETLVFQEKFTASFFEKLAVKLPLKQ